MATPEKDAEALRNAMKGLGTDEDTIIKIVANRTNAQRQKIKSFYKSAYGRDLVEDLKKELSGKFEDAVIALFYEPIEYDCFQLRKAMKGLGTDEDTLIEIIATRPNWMIKAINQKYEEMHKRNLIKDVEITPPEAVLGCSKEISTLHGKINIKIPAGVSSGQSLRLKQMGLPKTSGYGDLNAKIKIIIPKNLSKEVIDLYKKIAELS